MRLADSLEHRRTAVPILGTLGIDDRNRSALADPRAVHVRAQNPAVLREPEFLEPLLQELPRREPAFLLAALGVRLIAAEKDVAARHRRADGVGHCSLRIPVALHTPYSSGSHVNPSSLGGAM